MTTRTEETVAALAAQSKPKNPSTLDGMLKDSRYLARIKKALPATGGWTPERIASIASLEIKKNQSLAGVDPITLFGSILQSAQLGLEIGGALGHAYLVPFRSKKGAEAQFIVGYRGMIDLARRSGQIVSLQAHEVRANDEFDFEFGLDEKLVHKPAATKRGEVTHFYAVAKLVGGGHQIEVMSLEEVELVRNSSKAGQSGPWVSHFVEMGKKTVIRRLFKYLPVSVELQKAVSLDELADEGIQTNRDWADDAIEINEFEVN